MKKIGILTFHDTTNFGSWIQTFGLYYFLEKRGENIDIIDYRCDEIKKREKVGKRDFIVALKSNDIDQIMYVISKYQKQNSFKKLSKKYMRKNNCAKYTGANIRKANKKYDVFIVGSDLVWDYRITNNDNTYLLSFTDENKKCYSYASSTGFVKYDLTEKMFLKEYLHKFNRVTVREIYDVNNMKNEYNINAQCVCDPSMLLPEDEWKKFVGKNSYGDYICIYFFDTNGRIREEAKRYALKNRLKILVIGEKRMMMECGVENVFPKNVEEFLTVIYYSKKVFTASYHGMMMSLILKKQLSYAAAEPESRMQSIAELMDLDKYNVDSEFYNPELEIEYSELDVKLEEFICASRSVLEEMVG